MTAVLTLKEIAKRLDGTVVGDPHVGVRSLEPLATAGETDLSFLANVRYAAALNALMAVIPRAAWLSIAAELRPCARTPQASKTACWNIFFHSLSWKCSQPTTKCAIS